MKAVLAAVNAKYIHSNPAVYSLRAYAQAAGGEVEIREYTINHRREDVLRDLFQRSPQLVGFSCYIWNISMIRALIVDLALILPDTAIWLGGPEVSFDCGRLLGELPQVKGIISDCAFTSMKEVFTHVLHSMYHIPAFPMLQIADWANKRQVGYGLDDLSSAREVRKAKVPFLFIHGEDDVFVPCWMTEEIYKNCASPKTKLIVKGAGHGESYYKDTEGYERAMDSFIGGVIK